MTMAKTKVVLEKILSLKPERRLNRRLLSPGMIVLAVFRLFTNYMSPCGEEDLSESIFQSHCTQGVLQVIHAVLQLPREIALPGDARLRLPDALPSDVIPLPL
jgi:hypothetical protein